MDGVGLRGFSFYREVWGSRACLGNKGKLKGISRNKKETKENNTGKRFGGLVLLFHDTARLREKQ